MTNNQINLLAFAIAVSAISAPAFADVSFPSCDRLADFPISTSDNVDRALKDYIMTPLAEWADSDIARFRDVLVACKRSNLQFQRRYEQSYFTDLRRGPVALLSETLRRARLELISQAVAVNGATSILSEALALKEKAKDLSLSQAERRRLEDLKAEANSRSAAATQQNRRTDVSALREAAQEVDKALELFDRGVKERDSTLLAKGRQNDEARSDQIANAITLFTMYAMVERCADQGKSITSSEIYARSCLNHSRNQRHSLAIRLSHGQSNGSEFR